MQKISSSTFYSKRVFPVVWLGICGIGTILPWTTRAKVTALWEMVLPPVLMIAVGVVVFWKLLWTLADEVNLAADWLLVRKGAIEERVPLKDVLNVSLSHTRPPRVVLRLRKSGKLGDEIAFIPRGHFSLNPFARNPVAEDLIQRVERARGNA